MSSNIYAALLTVKNIRRHSQRKVDHRLWV
ncbi:unnamed protein product [Acanthoscelides obtectus]|uniref:Uncharacterized protein n=1 Tax=Acanthoscelides obtectus TaxID=200917 RepID=A0A9P0K8V4_ACAOB|nr:unnamed protein product [Acanthoscelides obtectus]CAK1632324.1 hypothetical protein AOBTE_LOCUS7483 [Acanthoscelides obtectus]